MPEPITMLDILNSPGFIALVGLGSSGFAIIIALVSNRGTRSEVQKVAITVDGQMTAFKKALEELSAQRVAAASTAGKEEGRVKEVAKAAGLEEARQAGAAEERAREPAPAPAPAPASTVAAAAGDALEVIGAAKDTVVAASGGVAE